VPETYAASGQDQGDCLGHIFAIDGANCLEFGEELVELNGRSHDPLRQAGWKTAKTSVRFRSC
jgi:hypothetical protein